MIQNIVFIACVAFFSLSVDAQEKPAGKSAPEQLSFARGILSITAFGNFLYACSNGTPGAAVLAVVSYLACGLEPSISTIATLSIGTLLLYVRNHANAEPPLNR